MRGVNNLTPEIPFSISVLLVRAVMPELQIYAGLLCLTSNRYQLVKHHLVDSCCHYTITNTLACIQMYGHSGIYLVYMLNCRCSEAHAREAMKFRSRYFSWYVRLAVDLTN